MTSGNDSAMTRILLIALLVFGALNAFAGGYYGLAGADGVPSSGSRAALFRTTSFPA